MELIRFTATNYRSIRNAQDIKLSRKTVLIGPNNEGKSNILLALVTAMKVIEKGDYFRGGLSPRVLAQVMFERGGLYDYERDYPKDLQNAAHSGVTSLRLEFELDSRETGDFRRFVGSSLNGSLPLELRLGFESLEFRVKKQGPGGQALTAKKFEIAKFVSQRIRVEHIAAVRTAAQAEAVVTSLVERELRPLEKDPQYKAALRQIEALQRPTLDKLENAIRDTLAGFLPSLKSVAIQLPKEDRLGALRRCSVLVDDGTKTTLQRKGDGAQSLAALGIMRHQSDRDAEGRALVIAIEEPESHLHPDAIQRLHEVVRELSQRHQVVLTTHCPLFADRADIAANIIVKNKTAKPAAHIDAIRKALGVRAADNLRHAEMVLLVEGEGDRVALQALLNALAPALSKSLQSGVLSLTSMGGATHLPFYARATKDSVCDVHAFLDLDAGAVAAIKSAISEGILTQGEVTQATCPGLRESELEDLLDPDLYDDVAKNYGIASLAGLLRGTGKWSARLETAFRRRGKVLDAGMKRELKMRVAERVAAKPRAALHAGRRGAFDALVEELSGRLRNSD
jgi:energy-coupling factor transporter ATP-binding protein EcfA2